MMFELMPFGNRNHDLFEEMDRFDREMRNAPFRTDVLENDDSFVLRAELPGFKKEDISVDITDGRLSISAETKPQEEENLKYVRREIFHGKFLRSFDIEGIDESAITASYRDGILELTLPKQKEVPVPTRTIEIR